MLEVRNISFAFGRKPILRDVSFVVSPGEIVSVVGPNGAGKTTLLKVLSTVLFPRQGHLLLDGLDSAARPLDYRRHIGYLPEDPRLDEDMTVKEYLIYRALLKGEMRKKVRRRVTEAAELCRVTPFLRTLIRSLSHGQKRRVALADAILLRPRVLLLDDFLAGLDADMRHLSATILSEAAAFSSVLVTGHELADFAAWSTRFLVLRDGALASVCSGAGSSRDDVLARLRASWEEVAS